MSAPDPSSEPRHCSCTSGNCLTLECECFKHGRFCDQPCQNKDCRNNEQHAVERLSAIEEILLQNPLAFTPEDALNQEECASICNFAMLTTSVDNEPFRPEHRETPLSRCLTPQVIKQAVKTVMSAANEDLNRCTPENFEEKTENSVAQEFANVLQTIVGHVKP